MSEVEQPDLPQEHLPGQDVSSITTTGDSGEPAQSTEPPQDAMGEENEDDGEPELVQGTIRGFYTDYELKPSTLAVGFDMTAPDEAARRMARQTRFADPSKVEEERQRTEAFKQRLQRFAQYTTPTENVWDLDYPQMLTDDEIKQLPQRDVMSELRNFDPATNRRWNAVHLIGTRMLSDNHTTQSLLHYYRDYNPIRIEWISDYRCNMVFPTANEAKRMLFSQSSPLGLDVELGKLHFITIPEQQRIEEQQQQQQQQQQQSDQQDTIEDSQQDNQPQTTKTPIYHAHDVEFLVWRRSLNPTHRNVSGSLSMRIATDADIKDPLESRELSQFYMDNEAYFRKLCAQRRQRQIRTQEQIRMLPADEYDFHTKIPARGSQHPSSESAVVAPSDTTMQTDGDSVDSTLQNQPNAPRNIVIDPSKSIRGRGFTAGQRDGIFDAATSSIRVVKRYERDIPRNSQQQQSSSSYSNSRYGDDRYGDDRRGGGDRDRDRDRSYTSSHIPPPPATLDDDSDPSAPPRRRVQVHRLGRTAVAPSQSTQRPRVVLDDAEHSKQLNLSTITVDPVGVAAMFTFEEELRRKDEEERARQEALQQQQQQQNEPQSDNQHFAGVDAAIQGQAAVDGGDAGMDDQQGEQHGDSITNGENQIDETTQL